MLVVNEEKKIINIDETNIHILEVGIQGASGAEAVIDWDDVENKPSTFPPATHAQEAHGDLDYVDLDITADVPTHKKGRVYWDKDYEVPAVQLSTGIDYQIGETIKKVCNNTGSTLLNGSAVYIDGSSLANGFPTVTLADASSYNKSRVIGVLTENILSGECGFVTSLGDVNGLNTLGFVTGDIAYLSPTIAGAIVKARPTASNFIVIVGVVTKISETIGRIYVCPKAEDYTVETHEVTGWSPYNKATIEFNNSLRRLTITPTGTEFVVYQNGVKYSKTTDSIIIPNTEGLYIVYYAAGVLTYALSPSSGAVDTIIRTYPTVAYIYWDVTNQKEIYLAPELHTIEMPSTIHSYLHFVLKARWMSGLAPNTVSADASGNLASSAQFGIDAGGCVDEDLYFSTPVISPTVGLPIFYISGTSGSPTLRTLENAGFSVTNAGSGRLAYNSIVGGNWTLNEVNNNDYALCHIFFINDNTPARRVIAMVGQAQYASTALAREGAAREIADLMIAGLVPAEMKAIATFVFQTSNTYLNAVKSRIISFSSTEDYVDFRLIAIGGGSGGGSAGGIPEAPVDGTLYGRKDGGWATVDAAKPSGADTQVQYNDAGIFGGNSAFTYNKVTGSLHLGAGIEELPNNPLAIAGEVDTYLQANIKNRSAGVDASSDFIATADNGDDTTHYADFGKNNSNYDNEDYEALKAGDAYVLAVDDDLDLVSTKDKIKLVVGGTLDANVVGEVNANGLSLVAGKSVSIGGTSIQTDWNAASGVNALLNKPSAMPPTSHGNESHSTAFATDSDMSTAESNITALQSCDLDIQSSGLVSGGEITINTDVTKINIAGGKGYVHSGATYIPITWAGFTGISYAYVGNNYVSISSAGSVVISNTLPDLDDYIFLGYFFYNSGLSQIRLVWNLPERIGNYSAINNLFVKEAIGSLVSSGLSVSEYSTPLRLSIASGVLYVNMSRFNLSQQITFVKLHNTADNGITPDLTNVNYVNTTQWNDVTQNNGSALINMTAGYWKKDLVFIGVNNTVYLAYGTAEYATEDEAKAAPLPSFSQTLKNDYNTFLATIVSQKNDSTIANRIYDVRPLFSRIFGTELSSSGGTVTDHGSLTGLADDDHTQYQTSARADSWLATKTQDNLSDGTTYKRFSATEQLKLSGIATGAEVNVQADWNAGSGDAQILNKPTIPTQYTDELAQDAAGAMATGSLEYVDATPALQLKGDLVSAGNSKYYGTNGTGTKGFHDLPTGGGGTDNIGLVIDGGGSAITAGSKGFREIPFDCTITGWTILGKESGSCVIDIKRSNYAGFPSTVTIAGTEKPTLSSAQKNQDLTLSSWTTSISAGDILEFVVDSATTVTRIMLSIRITK